MSNVPDFGINESYEDKAVNNSVDKRSEDSIHFEKDDVDGFKNRNANHRQDTSASIVSQFSGFGGESYSKCDNGEYQHLFALQGKIRRWYQQELYSLNVSREQLRLFHESRTKSADRPSIGFFSFRVECMGKVSYDAQEFLQVVFFGGPIKMANLFRNFPILEENQNPQW
ncbi:hypothetical protein Plhal304r1_c068g0156081 [Plasmopara halstedii]